MEKHLKLTVLLLNFVAVSSFAETAQPKTTPSPANQTREMTNQMPAHTGAPAAQPTTPGIKPPTDSQTIAIVFAANNADIDGGKLAQSKAVDTEVKNYGKMMVEHHTDANKKLKKLQRKSDFLEQKNETSKGIDSLAKDTENSLKKADGKAFDQAYIDAEVSTHQMVLTNIDQNLLPNAQSKEVKDYLNGIRPVIASHLDLAKKIQMRLKEEAMPSHL